MAGPRLTKLTCPECGAALHADNGVQVVTCGYCNKSSFVHWPDRPAPPSPTMPHYGNIHVPAAAVRTAGAVVVLMIVLPMVLVLAIGSAVAILVAGTSPRPSPPVRTSAPAGPACERAVACCKTIQPSNAGCDAMRLMSEAQCADQATSLATAAKAMGKSCK